MLLAQGVVTKRVFSLVHTSIVTDTGTKKQAATCVNGAGVSLIQLQYYDKCLSKSKIFARYFI